MGFGAANIQSQKEKLMKMVGKESNLRKVIVKVNKKWRINFNYFINTPCSIWRNHMSDELGIQKTYQTIDADPEILLSIFFILIW